MNAMTDTNNVSVEMISTLDYKSLSQIANINNIGICCLSVMALQLVGFHGSLKDFWSLEQGCGATGWVTILEN